MKIPSIEARAVSVPLEPESVMIIALGVHTVSHTPMMWIAPLRIGNGSAVLSEGTGLGVEVDFAASGPGTDSKTANAP